MHHLPLNQEKSPTRQSSKCPAPVSFPVLSQIKPQNPHLVCPSVNSFKFQSCGHTPPGNMNTYRFLLKKVPSSTSVVRTSIYLILSHHRLLEGLRRYLIIFKPPHFVLDRRKCTGWMLSHLLVLRQS